jgi:acyl-coenzyme A thioesterase PaaI-like protein
LHLLAPATVGPLRADGRVLRAGSRQVLADCTLYDEGSGVIVAGATANHSVLPAEGGAPMSIPTPDVIFRHQRRGDHGDERRPRPPLLERYGVAPVPGIAGAAELEITGPARNPWGIMHGSLFALVAEQALASARPGRRIDDLMLRFLAPARVGPARAQATHIGGTLWRVDVRDCGNDERLCCTAFARLSL